MHYVYRIALSGLLCITPLMHSMQKPTFHVNVKSNFRDIFLFGMGIGIGAAIGSALTFTYCTLYQTPSNKKVLNYIEKQNLLIKAQQTDLLKQERELLKQQRELVRAGLRGKLPFFTVEPNGSIVRTANPDSSEVDHFFQDMYKQTKKL